MRKYKLPTAQESRDGLLNLAGRYDEAAAHNRKLADDLERHAAQLRASAAAIKDE